MKESDKKEQKSLMTDAIVITVIVAIIAIVIFLLTYKKETHTTNELHEDEMSTLVCTSHDNEAAFFKSDTAKDVENTIKYVYNDGDLNKISYEYTGEYGSKAAAEHDDAVLHARYNTYMGEHKEKSESLTPVFQVVDNKLTIKLYLDSYKNINSVIGKLFYVGNGLEGIINKNSIEETKNYFEKKDFSCIISE